MNIMTNVRERDSILGIAPFARRKDGGIMFAFLLKESSDIKNYLKISSSFQFFFPSSEKIRLLTFFPRSGDLRRIRHSDEWGSARETMLMNSLLYFQSVRFDECFISCLKRDWNALRTLECLFMISIELLLKRLLPERAEILSNKGNKKANNPLFIHVN